MGGREGGVIITLTLTFGSHPPTPTCCTLLWPSEGGRGFSTGEIRAVHGALWSSKRPRAGGSPRAATAGDGCDNKGDRVY